MKKSRMIAFAIFAIQQIASVAYAGNLAVGDLNEAGNSLPALRQTTGLNDQTQCEFDRSNLQGQLESSQNRVAFLEFEVRRLTPGTCENHCYAHSPATEEVPAPDTCMAVCSYQHSVWALQNAAKSFQKQESANEENIIRNFR